METATLVRLRELLVEGGYQPDSSVLNLVDVARSELLDLRKAASEVRECLYALCTHPEGCRCVSCNAWTDKNNELIRAINRCG